MRITSTDIWTVVVPTIPGRVQSAKFGPSGWDMVPKHIIRINTDEGFYGLGETGRGCPLEAVQQMAAEIKGLDPRKMILQQLPATGSLDAKPKDHYDPNRWWETAEAGPTRPGYEAFEMAIIDRRIGSWEEPCAIGFPPTTGSASRRQRRLRPTPNWPCSAGSRG
jgi:L-alanine-DL-glutamate epimerase-like enolase superfamily enzyme